MYGDFYSIKMFKMVAYEAAHSCAQPINVLPNEFIDFTENDAMES